jgi:hypothetical protein
VSDITTPATTMVVAENIALWKGKDVFDPGNEKLGKFDELFYDGESDVPAYAGVKGGLVTKHLTLVPLMGAAVGPDFVRVSVTKEKFKNAPSFGADEELSSEDEASVYGYYDLAYAPTGAGARRLAKR